MTWRLSAAVVFASALLGSVPASAQPSSSSLGERLAAAGERLAAAESPEQVAGDAKTEPGDAIGSKEPPSAPKIDGRANYRSLIETEARREGLAPEIAEAVMGVESGYNPAAIGGAGEIGLMQILPSTARMLGFAGSNADLAVPATNVHYGVTYLAQAWRRAGGDLCTAVMKYRAGHGETRFSFLSINYCLAVRSKLAARGFRVTGNVPVATFGAPGAVGCKRKCLGGSRIGTVNLAALNMKLGALVAQVKATR